VTLIEQSQKILAHDIDPDFLASACIFLAWEYHQLYESLKSNDLLPVEQKLEQFAARRSACAVDALLFACKKHGVPYDFRRLECNGQLKLLVKVGRVVLIHEPIAELEEHPRVSDYKRELADTHGLIRQLELNLGDQPSRILDWSGEVLAVLLHAPAGPKFNRRDRALGGLMLAVPDAAYAMWILRLDLYRVAMYGFEVPTKAVAPADSIAQRDHIVATLKSKRRWARTGTAG
jgi:hypothetical protein